MTYLCDCIDCQYALKPCKRDCPDTQDACKGCKNKQDEKFLKLLKEWGGEGSLGDV